jgi:hypothetical protein
VKPTLFAVVSLVLGIALGWVWTRVEFSRDRLPLVLVAGAGQSAASLHGPRAVVVNGERHDFGTMDRLAQGEHAFQIHNDGDAPLELQLGKTTCKCTLGELADSKLEPGQTTTVTLTWQVKTGEAMFEQNAEIITNDPHHNPIHLIIHGNVIDTLKSESSNISFGDLSANEKSSARVRVFAYRAMDLQIEKHEFTKPETAQHFSATFEPLSAEEVAAERAASGVAVNVHVEPGLPLGPLAQQLKLTTNLPDHDPLEITIEGTVVSDVSIVGPGVSASRLLVNLGTLKHGEGTRRTVYIVVKGPHRADTKLELVSVEPSQDFQATLGERVTENQKVDRYPLLLEVPASAAPVARTAPETFARVKFAITHPQVKELVVQVRYIVKD